MRRLLNPLPTGGFPLELEDLDNLQDSLYTSLQQFYSAVGKSYVVSGCEVQTSDTTALTCKVNAGFVWLDNELRYFPGYQGAYPFYIISANDVYSTKLYQNGSVQNSYVEKLARAATSQPTTYSNAGYSLGFGLTTTPITPTATVTGGYIYFNPDNKTQRIIPLINAAVATGLQAEIDTRSSQFDQMSATITALNNLLNTKAQKLFTRIPWTNIVLEAGNTTATSQNDISLQIAQYSLDELGTVRLRGVILPGALPNTQSLQLGSLPTSILPSTDLRLIASISYSTNYFTNNSGSFSTYANGSSVKEINSAQLFISGKNSGSGRIGGSIWADAGYPIKDSMLVSLDGVSWNIAS